MVVQFDLLVTEHLAHALLQLHILGSDLSQFDSLQDRLTCALRELVFTLLRYVAKAAGFAWRHPITLSLRISTRCHSREVNILTYLDFAFAALIAREQLTSRFLRCLLRSH